MALRDGAENFIFHFRAVAERLVQPGGVEPSYVLDDGKFKL
jgi:hypothetical protein